MEKIKKLKKNPWLAAVLNFLFWGGGYIYNGKRVNYGIGLVVATFIVHGLKSIFLPIGSLIRTIVSLVFIGLSVYFAIDGYKEAKNL